MNKYQYNPLNDFLPKYVLKWDDNLSEGEVKSIGYDLYFNPFDLVAYVTKMWGYERALSLAKEMLHKRIDQKFSNSMNL